jgi:hypothetical protein
MTTPYAVGMSQLWTMEATMNLIAGALYPVDWEEEEDFTRSQCSFQFVDECVIPRHQVLAQTMFLGRQLCFLHVAAVPRCNPECTETVTNDTALRLFDNVSFLATNKHDEADTKHDEREQVRTPEADMRLKHRGCNR